MTHLHLPPEDFYWSLIELPSSLRRRPGKLDADQLGYLFEGDLPVPLEAVHAAFAPIDAGHVLACALAVDRLREFIGAHPSATSLTPAALPDFVAAKHPGLSPNTLARLNLLTGAFEPRSVGQNRRRLRFALSAAALALIALLVIGLERRTAGLNARSNAIVAYESELYDELVPASPVVAARTMPQRPLPPGSHLPAPQPTHPLPHPAVRLTAELRRLRLTRGSAAASTRDAAPTQDAAVILANLLAAWPAPPAGDSSEPLYIQTESLSIDPTGLSLAAILPDQDAAQRFQAELGSPPGFTKQQPQITAERKSLRTSPNQPPSSPPIRVVIRFLPIAKPGAPGAHP